MLHRPNPTSSPTDKKTMLDDRRADGGARLLLVELVFRCAGTVGHWSSPADCSSPSSMPCGPGDPDAGEPLIVSSGPPKKLVRAGRESVRPRSVCTELGDVDSLPTAVCGTECWRECERIVCGLLDAGECPADDSDIQLRDIGSSPATLPRVAPLPRERRFLDRVRSESHGSECAARWCARRAECARGGMSGMGCRRA